MEDAKSATLSNILAAAKEEFLKKGFLKASLRETAKNAGVTTGALYGYFASKEEIFESLAGEAYGFMIGVYKKILTDFFSLSPEEQQRDMMDYSRKGIDIMTDYMYSHKDELRLLLCCSEGTRFENFVHEMAELDVDATHSFAETAMKAGTDIMKVNPTLEHMLTSGMFTTYFELIVHNVPRDEADEYINQMLEFYNAGWARIMGL